MMHSQPNKLTKRASKRRSRNKRRKKQRQQRKIQAAEGKSEPFKSRRRTYHKKQLAQQQQQQLQSPDDEETKQNKWQALCLETYQRLTTWQSEAELNFWKARTEYLQNENKLLKEQLESLTTATEEAINDEEDHHDEEEEVDAGYLEFISITHKHREELRRAREAIKAAN